MTTIGSLDQLYTRRVSVPRVLLVRITRVPPSDPDDKVFAYASTAAYETMPTDVEQIAFDPRILDWSYDWSRVAGDGAQATLSGRSAPNKARLELANADKKLDAWFSDGRKAVLAEVWEATLPQFGLSWNTIRNSPTYVFRVARTRPGKRKVVLDFEGAEGLLEGIMVRGPDDVFLGLGDALEFKSALDGMVTLPWDPAFAFAQRLDLELIFFAQALGRRQSIAANGPLGTAGSPWLLFLESDNTLKAFLKGAPAGINIVGPAVEAGRYYGARLLIDLQASTASLWLDGTIAASADLTGFTFDAGTRDITLGGDDATAARRFDGLIADARIAVDGPVRAAEDVERQALRQLRPADGFDPTAYFRINEGLGAEIVADDPTYVATFSAAGVSWAPSLTGDPEQHGEIFPTALGAGRRAAAVRASRHFGGGWHQVHGGNRRDEPVHGMGPADVGGAPLMVSWGEPKVSTAIRIEAGALVVEGGAVDVLGLAEGQDIQLVTDSGVNDGRYALSADSTESQIPLGASALTPEAAGQSVTITTAGRTVTSSRLSFEPQATVLDSTAMGAFGGWTKYLHPLTPTFELEGTAANDGVALTPVQALGGRISATGLLTPEGPGRRVLAVRTYTVDANDLAFGVFISATLNRQQLQVLGADSTYPGFLRFRKVWPPDPDRYLEITVAGSSVPGSNITFRALRTVGGSGEILWVDMPAGGPVNGTSTTPATLTVKEVILDLDISSERAAIVSHEQGIDLTGFRPGGTVAVAGAGGNDGTYTVAGVAISATGTRLEVEEPVAKAAAGGTITLVFDDDAVMGIRIFPSIGAAWAPGLLLLPMSIATRGCAAGGFARTGAEIFERLVTRYAGLDPAVLDAVSLAAWGAADPHDRWIQILEALSVAEALDLLAQPRASWGATRRGNQLEVGQLLPPDGLVGTAPQIDLDMGNHFGLRDQGTQLPARHRPLLGARNMVPLTDEQIAGIVRTDHPERLTAIQQEWLEVPAGGGDPDGVDDPPVPTTYADIAGLEYAAALEIAFHGVPRLSFRVGAAPVILTEEPREVVVVLTDDTVPQLASGRPMLVLAISTRLGDLLKFDTRVIG